MADTLQSVFWALEWECGLRKAAAIHDIHAAREAVATAHSFGRHLTKGDGEFGVFGDVFVSSVTTSKRPAHLTVPVGYPKAGYIISEKFKDIGGPDGLIAMCKECTANAQQPFPAGCVGHLSLSQDERVLELLATQIERQGLHLLISDLFLRTTPIWFGLWARSPLSPDAAGVLAVLLEALKDLLAAAMDEHQIDYVSPQLDAFISAARIAEVGTAKLHVYMPPPGHTDFGDYTIFPHCPRCKAGAEVELWPRKGYSTDLYRCKVCGADYSPAAQASIKKDDWDEDPELPDALGIEWFRQFAQDYLVSRGMSVADAAKTVELTEADHEKQKINSARAMLAHAAKERYIQESLYIGLKYEKIPIPERDSDDKVSAFRAEEFEKLLKRCADRGIKVMCMSHRSDDKALKRFKFYPHRQPLLSLRPTTTFRRWRRQGCNEFFWASFYVPDELVERFNSEHRMNESSDAAT